MISKQKKPINIYLFIEVIGILLFLLSASEKSIETSFLFNYSFSKFLLLLIHFILIVLVGVVYYFVVFKNLKIKKIIPHKLRDLFVFRYGFLFSIFLILFLFIHFIQLQNSFYFLLLKSSYFFSFVIVILLGIYVELYFDQNNERKRKIKKYSAKNILNNILIIVFLFLIFLPTLFIRNESFDNSYEYENMDATYHVLLTVKSYMETPITIHKFLPIVTLGESIDKNINWGAAVPDEFGNFYYISFPQFGFIFPYIYFKLFNIMPDIKELINLNFLLNFFTGITLFYLVSEFLKTNKIFRDSRLFISFLSVLIYFYSTESLFSQGPIYWHHSLFQFLWILQLLCLLRFNNLKMNNEISVFFYPIFTIVSFLIPFTEWTGYLSNFILFITMHFYFKNKKITNIIYYSTVLSLIIYIIPFVKTVDMDIFLTIMKKRFITRSIASNNVNIFNLFTSYFSSFGSLLILLVISFVLFFYKRSDNLKSKMDRKENIIFFIIISFPCLENILLKQHAYYYHFDRLKVFIPLLFLFLQIIPLFYKKKLIFISIFTIIVMSLNLISYRASSRIVDISYAVKQNNRIIAEIKPLITSNTVLCLNNFVRGWPVLAFNHNIYENQDIDSCIAKIEKRDSEQGIMLYGKRFSSGFYEIVSYTEILEKNGNIITK